MFAGRRRLKLDMDRLALSADNLVHLGLIAVELVTNALKHGRGSIELAVKRDEDCLKIVVSDEGAGFPASFDPAARRPRLEDRFRDGRPRARRSHRG